MLRNKLPQHNVEVLIVVFGMDKVLKHRSNKSWKKVLCKSVELPSYPRALFPICARFNLQSVVPTNSQICICNFTSVFSRLQTFKICKQKEKSIFLIQQSRIPP